MRGKVVSMLRINTERLGEIIKAKYGSYQAVEDASRDAEGKTRIAVRTLYNLMAGQGWRSDTVNVLCEVLGISPSEIVIVSNGDSRYTHASPRPAHMEEELQAVG